MSTNITIDILGREFDEANEKFKALSISDFGNHVDKQKMMQELQKVKFVAEAALENCKSSDFNDNNDSSAEHVWCLKQTLFHVVLNHKTLLVHMLLYLLRNELLSKNIIYKNVCEVDERMKILLISMLVSIRGSQNTDDLDWRGMVFLVRIRLKRT